MKRMGETLKAPIQAEEKPLLFSKLDLRRLIIPLLIEQMLAVTVGMIDTIMVARVSEAAMSGVSLVDAINMLIINLFAALATGGAIVAGQYMGKRENEKAKDAAKQLIVIITMLSLVIMAICLLRNHALLNLVFGQAEEAVMENARTYFYVTAVAYPFIAIYNVSAALFRIMGNSKIAMVNALIMNVVNVIGNSIFIFGMNMGAFGAGLSTTISRIVAATAMLLMLRNRKLPVHVRSYFPRLDFVMIKRILRIGIPNGLEGSLFQLGRIMVTSIVTGMGTVAIAAHAVAGSLAGISVIPGLALNLAMTTVIARCVGAGDYEQAQMYIKKLMKQAYIYMFIVNVGMLCCMTPILGLYRLIEETRHTVFGIMMIHNIGAIFIWVPALTLPNAFRAASDVRYTMVISIFSMWVFRIGCSYLFAYVFEFGVYSVWMAMVVDWVVRSSFFVLHWRNGSWKQRMIL